MKSILTFLSLIRILTSPASASGAPNNFYLSNHQELLQRKPDSEGTNVKLWTIKQNSLIRINLVEMKGKLALHKHPDADHSIMVLEGTVRASVGDTRLTLKKGDFLTIPKNIPHQYESLTPSVYVISMDAPYYDPKKTIQIQE